MTTREEKSILVEEEGVLYPAVDLAYLRVNVRRPSVPLCSVSFCVRCLRAAKRYCDYYRRVLTGVARLGAAYNRR